MILVIGMLVKANFFDGIVYFYANNCGNIYNFVFFLGLLGFGICIAY